MQIPDEFKLAGFTITVVDKENLVEERGIIGEAVYSKQLIYLDKNAVPVNETVEQAYLHELVHWILYVMNEDQLKDNEKFVDIFAHLLYQAISSGEQG